MPRHKPVPGCFAGVSLQQWEHMDNQEVRLSKGKFTDGHGIQGQQKLSFIVFSPTNNEKKQSFSL
jgi:hypothetical protein